MYLAVAAILIWVTYRWYRSSQTVGNYGDRYVFITGCDTGFGNLLTKKLDAMGFHVFAGCLTQKGMEQLKGETSNKVRVVQMDVTKTESIQTAFEAVKSSLPENKGLYDYQSLLGFGSERYFLARWRHSNKKYLSEPNSSFIKEVTNPVTCCLPVYKPQYHMSLLVSLIITEM